MRLAPVLVRRDVEIHRSHAGPYPARWHFSFGEYQDPVHMGIGALRAFNDEHHPPAARLAPHPHSHAQCLTYVVAGELRHRDAELESGLLSPGGVQRMTLTSRAEYLEWNPSDRADLELLHIWLGFDRSPTQLVEQRQYRLSDRANRWLQVARPHGHSGTGVAVDSDASVQVTHLDPRRSVGHTMEPGRAGYAYMISGTADLNMHRLQAGDAALITALGMVVVDAHEPTELMLVDTRA